MTALLRCRRLLLAVVVVLAVAGCVDVPTDGPVEKVEGLEPACQSCVNVDVDPPAPGESPLDIVKGFLAANANYQPGYLVAKQYLTRDAAARWSPDDSASIYTGSPSQRGDEVRLTGGRRVGFLDQHRSYTRLNEEFNPRFELVQEDGEWRIGKPIPGLLIDEYAFTARYTQYDLFFVGSAGTLVPDPVHLPPLRNPATYASTLVNELLDGPSTWLDAAVESAVPEGTSLDVDSVTITDGVARVPLSGPGLQQLDDTARRLLAAQLVYTLKQLTTVQKVLLLVDSVPFQVPQSELRGLAVPTEDISPELSPVPGAGVEPPLHAVVDGAVVRVTATTDKSQVEPVEGALGTGRSSVDSLAVSGTGSELAVVTDDGTRLRRSVRDGADLTTVLRGVDHLLRPQVSRTGEIWAVGQRDGQQALWVVLDGTLVRVATPLLDQGRVRAFRLSPDGCRIALVIADGARTRLSLALVQRPDRDSVAVVDPRELDVSGGQVTSTSPRAPITGIRDVAWADATNLLVLAGSGEDTPYALTRIRMDASAARSESAAADWDPVEVTVLLRTETAVVRTRDGQVYRDEGQQWSPLLSRVTAVAYPG